MAFTSKALAWLLGIAAYKNIAFFSRRIFAFSPLYIYILYRNY